MTESSHLRKTFLMEIAWAMAPTLCLCWRTKLLKIIPQLSAECCETYCACARIQSPSNVFLFFFFFLCQRCLVSFCVTGWITNWILRGGVGVPFALSPCVFFYVTSPLCPNDAFEDAAVTWAPMTASVRAGDGCHHSFEFYILFHFFPLVLCHKLLEWCTAAGHYERPLFKPAVYNRFIIVCSYISHEAPLSVRGHLGGYVPKHSQCFWPWK